MTLPLLLLLAAVASPFPEFEARVKAYVDRVDRLEKEIGKLPDKATAEQVHAHKQAMADAVIGARANAKQGDFFVPADRDALVKLLREETTGAQGAPARKAIQEDNPKTAKNAPPIKLAPNAPWPEGAPLSTVPPRLLLRLPALPKRVDFRFVGKALVLRDTRANLILDYIPNALP